MGKKPNLLIIGASGGVAGAFLQKMAGLRQRFGRLVLIDRKDGLRANRAIPHQVLAYDFICDRLEVAVSPAAYLQLLENCGINIVLDLSVNETRGMLEATDHAGASYISTGIANRPGENFAGVVLDMMQRRTRCWHCPHILCAGMNPGVVNLWVRQAIERFGRPYQVIHFEYDTGRPVNGWCPVVTWSRETFLDEIVNDPAGYMAGRDRLCSIAPNPLKNRVSMEEILKPIMALSCYPKGFLLLHEENITLAQQWDFGSKFLFAIDPRTMDYLETVYDRQGRVPLEDLQLGDNRRIPIQGRVTIGVRLEYPEQAVYLFNTTFHETIVGASGSCWQVAAGIEAALCTLLDAPLPEKLFFMEDLFGTGCERNVMQNLPMESVVLSKACPCA